MAWREDGLYNGAMDAALSPVGTPVKDSPNGLHILVLDPLFRLTDQPGSTRTLDLARRLIQGGHKVSALTTTAAQAKTGTAVVDGISVTAVPVRDVARFGHLLPRTVGGAFARAAAWRMWRVTNVDAVIATDRPVAALPMAILFCAARGIPLVFEARNGLPPPPEKNAPIGRRVASWITQAVYRLAARYARQVVVLSRDVKDALTTQGVREAKIVVSAPGCDTALFATQPGANSSALTAYPLLARGHLVVYAGAMSDPAGLTRILEIAAATLPIAPGVTFALSGDGPSRGKIEAKALELGVLDNNLWLLDPMPRKDLPALLAASSAVIATDRSAASVFDALAAARAVVLIDTGWQRELIEGRGAGIGLPEDPHAAARELTDFLNDGDGLKRASQQAAALAAGRFNIDRIAAEVRGLIEDNVAADPRAAVLRRRTLRAKRALDIVASLAALIVLAPVFAGLAIAVQIKMGGPVLFKQIRPGLKGKLFTTYKFRTMTDAADSSGALLPDAARLTPFGRFLRRSSLDELPELFNVLIGDMSLVGPRPLLPEYLPYYSAEQRRRHDVLPGITGWAQVNGRNALTWEDRFALDVWYVEHLGLWLDFKIILKTVWIAITGAGISAPGHATMPRFDEIMARRQGAEDV